MLHIGCHLSSAKGYAHMGQEALSIGANVFQFFTRNPRGGSVKPMDMEDARMLNACTSAQRMGPLLAHAPYTMNPCAAKENLRAFALEAMTEDLRRLESIDNVLYNFHPGSHVGQGPEAGAALIAQLLGELSSLPLRTPILLETMAGKGSEMGGTFEEIAEILSRVSCNERLGVCLDTCHVYDAGYDIVNDLDGVLTRFDQIIGLKRLRAVHLNDSKNPMGSHKDRHACLGEGSIGLDALARIVNHPALRSLPFYLETPNDLPGYAREIALMKGLYRDGGPDKEGA